MSSHIQLGVLVAVATLICLLRMVAVVLGAAVYVYLLPAVIAMKRHHVHADKIMLVNAVAGWTVVVWFAALGVALACPDASQDKLPRSAG